MPLENDIGGITVVCEAESHGDCTGRVIPWTSIGGEDLREVRVVTTGPEKKCGCWCHRVKYKIAVRGQSACG
jgi:hypothetical protein